MATADESQLKQLSVREVRARRVLIAFAAVFVVTGLYEIANHNIYQGWQSFPWQGLRIAIPLVLIYRIWHGANWGRFALAAYCLVILFFNIEFAVHLPRMLNEDAFTDVVLVIVLLAGHGGVCIAALRSTAITGLINVRRDERELK